MEQELFEQAIAAYVYKQVDANNPQIVTYPLITQFRRRTIDINNPDRPHRERQAPVNTKTGNPVITPMGRFKNVTEASQALGIASATLYYRIRSQEGYEYAK